MFAKCNMITKRYAAFWADVEIMSQLTLWRPERFSIFNAEVPTIFVAQAAEPRYHRGQVSARQNHNVQVDDRLGSETKYCRTSHMLNRESDVAH